MAVVAAIGSLLFEGGTAISANQTTQRAKGDAGKALATAAKIPANEASAASQAAAVGTARQSTAARAAFGQDATILTNPLGAGPAPTQRKSLLGL